MRLLTVLILFSLLVTIIGGFDVDNGFQSLNRMRETTGNVNASRPWAASSEPTDFLLRSSGCSSRARVSAAVDLSLFDLGGA